MFYEKQYQELTLTRGYQSAVDNILHFGLGQNTKVDSVVVIWLDNFKQKMTDSLTEKMNPIVESSLSEVGALQSLNKVMKKYEDIPFVSEVNPNLTDYVVKKGIDGVFFYLAKQEAAIRQNPAKQTTALLKKVFGK